MLEVKAAMAKADTVRSKIIAGTLSFAAAATRYTEDEQAKFSGPYFLGRDGGPYVTIDLLDKDLVAMLDKLKPRRIFPNQWFLKKMEKKASALYIIKAEANHIA